jgi:hypothetical protein
MRLLVVDWDFFFPVSELAAGLHAPPDDWGLFDWAHNEDDPIFYEFIWSIRAADFLRAGRTLPQAEGWREFWKRFTIAPRASLFYADSNAAAVLPRVRKFVDEVWLYDAHHDTGYGEGDLARATEAREVTCENWTYVYRAQGAEVHMRYPQWRAYAMTAEPEPQLRIDRAVDDGARPAEPGQFDRVFVCRSPAWVPPWCDEDYQAFIAAAPVQRAVSVDGAKRLREFDAEAASNYAAMMAEVLPKT